MRKRRYSCVCQNRFNTIELPEEVFNDQKSRILSRITMFERGVLMRMKQARTRRLIDEGLGRGDKFEVIMIEAECSKSLVEKRAKELREGLT